MSNFRLLQLVMFAGFCLLILKSSAFLFSREGVLTGAGALQAQEVAPEAKAEKTQDKSQDGVAQEKEKAGPPQEQKPKEVAKQDTSNFEPVNYANTKVVPSDSKLDLLESLAARRKQLNIRETQLKLKENLLQAAQKQIDDRIAQLKALEEKIQNDLKKQDVLRQSQYRRLVKIYSSMKAKEAARIFNGLDMPVLVDLVRAMKAAVGSQILAKMEPQKARQLTLLLAKKDQMVAPQAKDLRSDLPAIKGEQPAEENQ